MVDVLFCVLLVAIIGLSGWVGYTLWHAHKHDFRRLSFFLFGECVPPATEAEREQWLRGM